MKFEELNLSSTIQKALKEFGYRETTPIQEKTIPILLEGKDVIGQSQTGTGKTASYGLPILQKIDPSKRTVQAMVLCPTRELAVQVTNELRKFNKYQEGVSCEAIYGGEPIERQITRLKRGVQIIVGTPGRVMDHMRRKTLKLTHVTMVVLDEADEMLNMGFEEDIETILKEVPLQRQTILFSATMNSRILKIAQKYLKQPVSVKIKTKELTVDKIEQISLEMKSSMKNETLMRLIDINNPKKAMVFCNTKKKVEDVIELLKAKGYRAEALHGDIKQAQRDRIMKSLKKGDFQILVATDVAARGIDVEDLEMVVNYDIPQEEEYYVHRIGRTGRNGKIGKAYTFVVGKEKSKIGSIQKYANTKLQQGKIPTLEEIEKAKNEKTMQTIQQVIDQQDFSQEPLLEQLLQTNEIKEIALALLTLVIKQKKIETKPKEKIMNEFAPGENTKLFFSLGKRDKIMVKDIVGSIAANSTISGSCIGKINLLDKFSFVEVPGEYVQDVLVGMQGKQIKGKQVTVEIASK